MDKHLPYRREFIAKSVTGICALSLTRDAWGQSEKAALPKRSLGKTGEKVSILGLGGWHLGSVDDDREAIRLARSAIDMGVTFMDSAWEYHEGRSERLLGKVLQDGYRQKVFLMTKHHGRDKQTALKHLEDSLRRLNTDVIDLWQFHEIIWKDDPEKIFSEGGGIEAAQEAKKAGKVRYIGFTGHKDPAIFLDMLGQDYAWDAVQMPVNLFDPHFRSFQQNVLPVLQGRNIGVIAMKSLAGGHLMLTGVATPEQALRYTWSQPVATIVSGMRSMEELQTNARSARSFIPMSQEEQSELLQKSEPLAIEGEYEPFKTSHEFDGPVGRQQHGVS